MNTPEMRYRNDTVFHTMVDQLEAMIHQTLLTPSEIRDAAMLACIHYEMRQLATKPYTFPVSVVEAVEVLQSYRMEGD